ncbi:MAG: tRNA (N(6)-L-threonylcarbamoyladenosine(37)-C(2))-methylthiotransferase MtaB [Bacilli bacterium]|nr:tRNA (N(6)-L-threonylcarbamoyladenosine(37)-C(2))-methylthiotransferase MtaB [Bacilli bacterium]
MKYVICTLGCKVNTYESGVMSDILENANYKKASNNEEADVVIINTCSVTNNADVKSKKLIRQMIRKHKNAYIIVTGCLSQVKADEIAAIEGVDLVIGNKNKTKILDYLKEKEKRIDVYDISDTTFEPMKLNNFNKTRAFVKIQDGCNNFCSYCIIPYTRGNVRSKLKEDVLSEVENLIKNGHQEIVLTGIHTGNYNDFKNNYDFASLLEDLVKIKGLKRLRISSIEMNEINDRVLKTIKENGILVDHMHIPLQSGTDKILKLMNRKYNLKDFEEKINSIRKIRPNISITTDVIVGFPNETDEDFNKTKEFIKKIKFSKLHVFPYSKRTGTKAALMENQIDEEVKKQRVRELLQLSKQLESEYANKFVLKENYFLPEIYKDGYLIGHTGNYLLIKAKGNERDLHILRKIKITSFDGSYCKADILN